MALDVVAVVVLVVVVAVAAVLLVLAVGCVCFFSPACCCYYIQLCAAWLRVLLTLFIYPAKSSVNAPVVIDSKPKKTRAFQLLHALRAV